MVNTGTRLATKMCFEAFPRCPGLINRGFTRESDAKTSQESFQVELRFQLLRVFQLAHMLIRCFVSKEVRTKTLETATKKPWYCRRKELMASVRKPREKLCASAFHPSKTRKPARKVGGEAAHFWCPFFMFWTGGTRSRIVSLEVFGR